MLEAAPEAYCHEKESFLTPNGALSLQRRRPVQDTLDTSVRRARVVQYDMKECLQQCVEKYQE